MSENLSEPVIANRSRFAKCDPEWLQLDLGGRELRVLLALSLHANWGPKGFGRCFPRRDTLALVTGLQVSHVSEAVGTLANKHHLITIVRLGRKNVYYVREIGAKKPMPPSDPEPFFEHLARVGIHLDLIGPRQVGYALGSRSFADLPATYFAILSDYLNGLTDKKIESALQVMAATPTGLLTSAIYALPNE